MYKRGQVTIFIIIGILIVAAGVVIYLFRDRIFQTSIPASVEPVYLTLDSCIEDYTASGVDILESQGGWIYLPEYVSGSGYMPFSSQLNFLGNPIPYWYYVSGNNLPKQQVPTKSQMEEQLAKFINEKITRCKFDSYYDQGFEIDYGNPRADVKINDKSVDVNLNMRFAVIKGDDSAVINSRKIIYSTNLGNLYTSAKKVYNYQQENLFLEEYSVDILRNYAPVDGVEITCAPKTWNADKIFSDIQAGIEGNILALRGSKNEYQLVKKENKYFVVDLPVSQEVRFLNSRNWTYAFEINPASGNMLIAKPVGNQEGLGVMGFCYVPYHFVYDLKYPVLVQIREGNEIFQFPVAVIVEGNLPRKSANATAVDSGISDICQYRVNEIDVNVYDSYLKSIDADISFECFQADCFIGRTSNGKLRAKFPQCTNGYIIAKAEGYEEERYLYESISPGKAEIILERAYPIGVNVRVDNLNYNGQAIISFISEKNSQTISYPETKSIKLTEGQYNISIEIYRNSGLVIPASTIQQCIEVPSSLIGGFFGLTKEKCFNIEMPEQRMDSVLAGGGKTDYFFGQDELEKSKTIDLYASSFSMPGSVDKLGDNYDILDRTEIQVVIR